MGFFLSPGERCNLEPFPLLRSPVFSCHPTTRPILISIRLWQDAVDIKSDPFNCYSPAECSRPKMGSHHDEKAERRVACPPQIDGP